MQADLVGLRLAGQDFTGWTGVSIGMAIDQVADTFSLSLPYDPANSRLRGVIRPFGYEPVEVRLDDELLLTGRVDKIDAAVSAGERMLTVEGRSLTGTLVDCGIEGALEYSGLALSTIARKICQPFGVAVRADNDTNPIEIARAEYGQSPADFLNSLAAPRNLFLNSSYDGKLVISWARTLVQRPAVATLIEGQHPILAVNASFDGTHRYSKYLQATQFAGAVDIVGQATDGGVNVYRPHLAAVGDTDTDPGATARRARTAALVGAVAVSVSLHGWRRPDGARWAERQAVTLKAPGVMLETETKYIIAGVTCKLDAGGKTVDLRLVLPELYAGEIPGSMPWE